MKEINISELYRNKRNEASKVNEQIDELKLKLDKTKLTVVQYENLEWKIKDMQHKWNCLISQAKGIDEVREMFMDAGNFDYVK